MYNEIAAGYNELHGLEQRRKLGTLLARCDIKENASVVDVGCGTAHLASFFAHQEYLGIDPSEGLLAFAPEGTTTVLAKGEDIPLDDACADVVLSLTALHNYDDPIKGVQELHRIAKDLVLVGILKKAPSHDGIIKELERLFSISSRVDDLNDTLLVLHKR